MVRAPETGGLTVREFAGLKYAVLGADALAAIFPAAADADVRRGEYEGGFRMWECALDLVRLIADGGDERVTCALRGRRVLEVGAGHGLPGIAAAALLGSEVDFQDYNAEVLRHLTAANVALNGAPAAARYFAGGWASLAGLEALRARYDAVLTSETIYDADALPPLLALLRHCLRPGGTALFAAKRFYFGVGGGVEALRSVLGAGSAIVPIRTWDDGVSNVREVFAIQF